MKYEEAFIRGFSDEMEKQALWGAVVRGAGWLGSKALGLGKGLLSVAKKDPLSAGMLATSAIPSGGGSRGAASVQSKSGQGYNF